jgi:hypothetical protein
VDNGHGHGLRHIRCTKGEVWGDHHVGCLTCGSHLQFNIASVQAKGKKLVNMSTLEAAMLR